jgi:hypothetical protein
MQAVGVVLGWVNVAVNAYALYQYLFENKQQDSQYKYTNGAYLTRVDNNACIPIIYGTVQTAGNLLYSNTSSDEKVLYKLISLSDGPVYSISNVKYNSLSYDTYSGTGVRIYMGSGDQPIDDIVTPGASQEDKARVVGGLKYEAYLACWATASEDLNGDFNVTAIVQGKIIKIYSRTQLNPSYVYDASIGYWYTIAWSDNPIWCILDFCTAEYGCGLSLDEIDMETFLDAAAYCDEPPLTGYLPKRFTLNIRIDEKRPRLDWITEMMKVCQAYPTYQNGKFGVMIEKSAEVSQVFKDTEINDLNIWWSPLNEIADVARVGYIEPGEEWVKVYAPAEAEFPLRDQPYQRDVDIVGCTHFNQATRLSWFYLNQSITCTMYTSFKTDRRALNRMIGEVIELQNEYIMELSEDGRSGKRFRITSKSEDSDGMIKIEAREYNEYLYLDQLGSAPPVYNVSKLPNPFSTPPDILGFTTLEQVYYIQKDKTAVSYIQGMCDIPGYIYYYQLRIFYREDDNDWIELGTSVSGQFTIPSANVGSTYYIKVYLENTYSIRSKGYVSDPIIITGKNADPSPVTNLKATEIVGGFALSWTPADDPDVDGYNIYCGNTADPAYLVAQGYSGTTYTYNVTITGTFLFHVRTVDTSGNLSQPASVTASIIPPATVQGFDVYQNGQDLDFRWKQNEGERNRVGYEIRRGQSWDLGEVIGRVNGNSYKISFASTKYTHTFWIKAISEFGVYSTTASYATIDVAPLPNRNMIEIINPVQPQPEGSWNGASLNFKVVDGGLMLSGGVKNGEQIYKIHLDQEYSARNWVDTQIIAVDDDLISWEQANFSWGSTPAQSMWLPEGQTSNAYISHQIARKSDVPGDVIEAFPLNDSLIGVKSATAPVKALKPVYQDGRFFDGLNVTDATYVDWNINLPAVFSIHFHVRLLNGIPGTCTIAMFKGMNGALLLGYNKDTNLFYLVDNHQNKQELSLNYQPTDYLSFGISQGLTTRKLFGMTFSVGKDKAVSNEASLAPIGVFTKFMLYGTI